MNPTPITKLPDGSAFFTADIMSKEEAMKLPVKERPICFRISSEMYCAVFEAIGEASVCWNPKPSNEVFSSERASDVAVRLCFKIAEEIEAVNGIGKVLPESKTQGGNESPGQVIPSQVPDTTTMVGMDPQTEPNKPSYEALECALGSALRYIANSNTHKRRLHAVMEAFSNPALKASGARAIAFHLRQGEPFAGLTKEALANWVEELAVGFEAMAKKGE